VEGDVPARLVLTDEPYNVKIARNVTGGRHREFAMASGEMSDAEFLMSAAAKGEEISLPGFGKFKVKETPEREGRNPTSGEKIKIAASRKLTYSPAKAVKELLNG